MILPIEIIGSPVLSKKATEINPDYNGIKDLIANMFETMYKAEGVGLAAPQVGLSIRLIVIDSEPMGEDDPSLLNFKKVLINPQILETGDEEEIYNEGCLSVPSYRDDVKRKTKIRLKYQDENFAEHDEWFEGRQAWIIQHEYDHLEGIVFPDRLSPLKKRLIKGKLAAISKGKFEAKYRVKLRN